MKEDAKQIIEDARVNKNVLEFNLCYPRIKSIDTFEIGLMDVRASDNIRVSYDFDRDGWVIKQATVFEWEVDDNECDGGWKEVAFIEAFGSEIKDA